MSTNLKSVDRRSPSRKARDGVIQTYLDAAHILDIGFRGGDPNAKPVTENAIGVDLDYPGYDGTHLPFDDQSQDVIHASHVLEHIPNYKEVLVEWYRVTRLDGFLIIIVPHRHLYERRPDLPSRWNGSHQRFYTPGSLIAEIENALPANSYRVRLLLDNDRGFNYSEQPDNAPSSGHEIVLVLQRIAQPEWSHQLAYPPSVQSIIDRLDALFYQAVSTNLKQPARPPVLPVFIQKMTYVTPWARLQQRFVYEGAPELNGQRVSQNELREAVSPLLACVDIDEAIYTRHGDLRAALAKGTLNSKQLASHWRTAGYFEGRVCHEYGLFDNPHD